MTGGMKREIRALASLIGTAIGAGIFGVPYVMSRAGTIVGLVYFVIVTSIITLLHLYFAEIALAVRARHRFPGFAREMLGEWGKRVAAILGIVGGWLALTVYLILGGHFLAIIFGPLVGGSSTLWSVIFGIAAALIVLGGLRLVSRSEVVMTSLLIVVVLLVTVVSAPFIHLSNFTPSNFADVFLPFGVILFALSGLAVIPELEDVVGNGRRGALRRVIVVGTMVPAVLTALFGVVVSGVTGVATTPDAISGLKGIVGEWIVIIGATFGFLAVITSHLTFLMNQVEQFTYDYRIPRWPAWCLAVGVPFVFFLVGARDFIQTIGLAGGLFGGLTGALLGGMYMALLRKRGASRPSFIVPSIVTLLFFFGALAEFFTFIRS